MAQFNQIQRSGHLPDMIASEIMDQVSSGILKPGDKLPPENILADNFGVSRNVVREAIARLRSDGVIHTKPGRGACVLPLSERASFRVEAPQPEETQRFTSLYELRGLLEIDAAGIAARRRSDDDLAALRASLQEFEGCKVFDEARLEADATFHRRIGAATGNEYLETIITYLSGRLKDSTRAARSSNSDIDLIEHTIAEHRAIYDAVAAGDEKAARKAMADHIRGAAERLGITVADRS